MASVTVSLRMNPREADIVRVALTRLLEECKTTPIQTPLSEEEKLVAGRYASYLLVELEDFRNTVVPRLTAIDEPKR
jgi:hypothetical protein